MTGRGRHQSLMDAVRLADEAIWEPSGGGSLAARNDAVRAALAGGWTSDDIAEHLRVRPTDVERWAGSASA